MVLKRFAGFMGRLFGQFLRACWRAGWKFVYYLAILSLLIIGALLALVGNIIVLLLGFVLNLCILLLKLFAKITEHLMITTKWVSSKVGDYTESFFEGVTGVFKQEEEHLEKEINLIIHTRNN